MDIPRETTLYRQVCAAYEPKKALMMLCKYIEGLERRIEALEPKEATSVPEDIAAVAAIKRRPRQPKKPFETLLDDKYDQIEVE